MSTKVIAFTRYAINGASSRLRIYQYVAPLVDYGIFIEVSPLFDKDYIERLYSEKGKSYLSVAIAYIKRIINLFSVIRYDVIFIEKELLPNIPGVFEYLLYSMEKKYIVDYDDAVFHCYDQSNNYYMKLLSKKIDKIMSRSSMVICGNDYIAARSSNANAKNIQILPTVVDTNKYKALAVNSNSQIVIGWIGTPSTVHLLEIVRCSLEALNEDFDFILCVIGAKFSSDIFKVECIKWSENTEIKSIQAIDIGIMPLNDGLFERGKCGYKLIQYMACGKPIIASPVGVNEKIVKESNAGCLAITVVDWTRALGVLCATKKLRTDFGVMGRSHVEKKYSLGEAVPKMAHLFKTIKQ